VYPEVKYPVAISNHSRKCGAGALAHRA
jgi:hypothetical protein